MIYVITIINRWLINFIAFYDYEGYNIKTPVIVIIRAIVINLYWNLFSDNYVG